MTDAVPLSEELLRTMRSAAKTAIERRDSFITPRTILLALLDDAATGPVLSNVINKEKVAGADVEEDPNPARALSQFAEGEEPGLTRYDTLAFKTPDGRKSVWLTREALDIFAEGAHRVDERYYPKQLALGLAAQARLNPGILAAIRVEPGVLIDAIYKL